MRKVIALIAATMLFGAASADARRYSHHSYGSHHSHHSGEHSASHR
jgi:hypothetical protein